MGGDGVERNYRRMTAATDQTERAEHEAMMGDSTVNEPNVGEAGVESAFPTAQLPAGLPSLHPTLGTLLALGVTLDRTTACMLENVSGIYRLVGWKSVERTPGTSLAQQGAEVCRGLGDDLRRAIWNEDENAPFLQSPNPIAYPPLEHFSAAVSPRPRMRVWLAGLTLGESLETARLALASAPLQLVGVTRLTADLDGNQLASRLLAEQPEAMVIVGGYDTPTATTHQWMLALCRQVSQALQRISPGQRPTIFYAGNQAAATAAEALLRQVEGRLNFQLLTNVLPYPGYAQPAPLAVALSRLYWQLCQRMPGFAQLSRWVTAPGQVANLESSFAQLVQIWMEYQQLPELHGLFCTPHWWLHVWADRAAQGVQLRFVQPNTRPQTLTRWPQLQFVSGEWPMQLWAPPATAWWDRTGLAPLLTAVGQVAPQAMIQVLEQDLIETRQYRA